MEELEPCPLCNGIATILKYEVDSNGLGWNPYSYVKIGCEVCQLFIDVKYSEKASAIATWSRRVSNFQRELKSLLRTLEDRTPDELARYLITLAEAALPAQPQDKESVRQQQPGQNGEGPWVGEVN